MYEPPANAPVHMCRSWTDTVTDKPLQKSLLNRLVRLPMLWRKRNPYVKRDENNFVEPISRFRDSRMNMYAKKLSKSSANLRTKNLQSCRISDENKNSTTFVSPTTGSSWQERADQLLAKLVRVHGSDWELIARQFSCTSSIISSEKTASELQAYWETVRQTHQQATTTTINTTTTTVNFLPSSAVFQSSSICSNKTDMEKKIRPSKFTQRSRSNLPPTKDQKKSRIRSLQPHNPSTESIRSKASFPNPVASIKTGYRSPRLSDWYSDEGNLKIENPSPHGPTTSFKRTLDQVDNKPLVYRSRFNEMDQHGDGSAELVPTSSPQSPSDDSLLHELQPSPSTQISSGSTTPVKLLFPFALDDSLFSVQTPTKAICESDQASFHLVSPPSIFGLAASSSSSNSVSRASSSTATTGAFVPLKPRVLFRGDQLADPASHPSPLATRTLNQQDTGKNIRFSNSVLIPESPQVLTDQRRINNLPMASTLLPKRVDTGTNPNPMSVSFPGERGTDSIALITAKATVWNRQMKEEQKQQLQQQQAAAAVAAAEQQAAAVNARQLSADILARSSSPSTSTHFPTLSPFPILSQRQPHLAIRRVLQVGLEAHWRRVAFGMGRMSRWTTRLARQFLEDSENEPP